MGNDNLEKYIQGVDDPAPEVEGDVKEDIKDQDKTEFVSDSSPENDGADIVKKQLQNAGVIEKGDDDDKSGDNDEKGDKVPAAFTEFARQQNWSDDIIEEFSSELSDEELLALIPYFQESEVELEEKPAKQEIESKLPQKSDSKPDDDKIVALNEKIAKLEEQMKESTELRERQNEQAIVSAFNQAMDEVSEDFEIFGKTDELLKFPAGPNKGKVVPTSPAMKARNEVWNKMWAFINAGASPHEAITDAQIWYKGKNLEKDIKRKTIKDLKKHEKKLSAKRSGKETTKQYENEEERKADVVRELARKAGVKGSFDL